MKSDWGRGEQRTATEAMHRRKVKKGRKEIVGKGKKEKKEEIGSITN